MSVGLEVHQTHSVDLRLSTDDLVAHAAFPLSEIRAGQMQEAFPNLAQP